MLSPKKESLKRIRLRIKETIREYVNDSKYLLSQRLNSIIRGWFNYYKIDDLISLSKVKRNIRHYLYYKLYKLHKRMKSQRSSRLSKLGALDIYIKRYSLIDPLKY